MNQAAHQAEGGSLGTNTNYASESEKTTSYRPSKWVLQNHAGYLMQDYRVNTCSRFPDTRQSDAVTIRRRENGKASFVGLKVCGSVWHCPVCAERISSKRREELQRAIDSATEQKMGVQLLTLTIPHKIYDSVSDLLPRVANALRRLKSGRRWKALQAEFGILGGVRAWEVTHGKNGWHPHIHEIVITKASLGTKEHNQVLKQFETAVYELWRVACAKSGLGEPSAEHGVDVRAHDKAAEYVSKWGLSSEMSRQHMKKGREGGRTPFDLLADYHGGDRQAGALFAEYGQAFHGRRQLVWSKGLRALLLIDEPLLDDVVLAQEEEQKSTRVVRVDNWVFWQAVKEGRREQIISLVENEEYMDLFLLLAGCAQRANESLGALQTGGRVMSYEWLDSSAFKFYINLGGDTDGDE